MNPEPFNASRGWLHRFCKRCNVKHALYQGEIASADVSAAENFPSVAQEIVNEGGYDPEQIFNCDETGVYWKKSPKGTYAPKGLRQAPGTKMAKDRFSVLLTTNVTGECKMKPAIIYKCAKPHSFRNCDMNNLPNCVWYHNKSGYMTAALSLTWFDTVFVPAARNYCMKKNLAFKVILFLDNAPGHAKYLVGRHPNVQVIFLPPNTTSKLQPLDQELIANVKLLFYGKVHNKLRNKTDNQKEIREIERENDSEEGHEQDEEETKESIISVKTFWKQFKIKEAVDYFCNAWRELTPATVKHVWKPLLPALSPAPDTGATASTRQEQGVLARATAHLIRTVPGLSNVSDVEINDLINDNQNSEQPIEDLIQQDLEEEKNSEEEMDSVETPKPAPTTKDISAILSLLAECETKVEDLMFEESDEAKHLLSKLTNLFILKLNEKIAARQQTLITRFMRNQQDRQRATLQMIINASDDDDDDDDFDDPPVLAEEDAIPEDEDMFDGWEEEEIEANRIERLARVSEQTDGQTDSPDQQPGPSTQRQ